MAVRRRVSISMAASFFDLDDNNDEDLLLAAAEGDGPKGMENPAWARDFVRLSLTLISNPRQ